MPIAARQADGSHFPDLSLFRCFTLAEGMQANDGRSAALVTRLSREGKVRVNLLVIKLDNNCRKKFSSYSLSRLALNLD